MKFSNFVSDVIHETLVNFEYSANYYDQNSHFEIRSLFLCRLVLLCTGTDKSLSS